MTPTPSKLLLALAAVIALGAVGGAYVGSHPHPLGKCIPGAHPAITLARCEHVQPARDQ